MRTKQPFDPPTFDAYPIGATPDQTVGTVTTSKATTHYVDVAVQLLPQDIGNDDDIVIRLNGRPIKRLRKWQAERLDLLIRPIEGSWNP